MWKAASRQISSRPIYQGLSAILSRTRCQVPRASLKSLKPTYRVCEEMSEHLSNLLCGTFLLALGTLILFNLEAVARLDQHSGIRLKSWFQKQLGKSVLNRELWPVGTPGAFRSSRIVLRIVGIFSVLAGAGLVALSFRRYFH